MTSSLASLWSSQRGQGPSQSGLISLGSYTIERKTDSGWSRCASSSESASATLTSDLLPEYFWDQSNQLPLFWSVVLTGNLMPWRTWDSLCCCQAGRQVSVTRMSVTCSTVHCLAVAIAKVSTSACKKQPLFIGHSLLPPDAGYGSNKEVGTNLLFTIYFCMPLQQHLMGRDISDVRWEFVSLAQTCCYRSLPQISQIS